ncbi:hypothetical protein INR49_029179 [Caranx melampygus]|nr:hypothetical protein INR49_029179 [Caranx melampygus]
MSEEHYLELCENPVQFEHASSVNNVFFDEANKQDFINFIPDYPHTEFTQECKVFPDKRSLKLLKSQSINVNWYQYCPETAVILLSTTVQGNILQPFAFRTSLIFDIKLKEPDCAVNTHQPTCFIVFIVVTICSNPCMLPVNFPTLTLTIIPDSSSWSVFQPDIIISASEGYLWYLQVKLPPTVNLLQDKGKLMDFLLQRRDCKMVILSVCSHSTILEGGEKGSLPVVATIFDKLNQVYKEYLEAEQSYTVAMESGLSRGSAAQKRPGVSHKFIIAVLMEYIRSLNQFQITVQHYLYELVIKTLVQHNLFYMLHQFLQYHVLSDSKPLACLLLSLESTYPPAHQLSLDMLKRLSTANDEIVEVLLSKQQVLGALRFIRSVGEHCEEHVVHFKQLFGEQALMKPSTSIPTRGGSPLGRMCSREGLVWISSSPWMKPSVGASPGGELEEEEVSCIDFKLLAEDSSLAAVVVGGSGCAPGSAGFAASSSSTMADSAPSSTSC